MRPFYFGSSEKPLYGVHHPPTARLAPRGAVVFCYPFGREYLRAHRAMREMANQLSAKGFHGLRFDYYGCGDSSGADSDGDVVTWVRDVGLAIEELGEMNGSREVSAVGIRLGAALCSIAASGPGVPRLHKLALWDPIVVGRRYLAELASLQGEWDLAHPGLASSRPSEDGRECLGFPLTKRLEETIDAIDLRRGDRAPADRVLVVTSVEDEATTGLTEALERAGARVENRTIPGVKYWLRQEGVNQAVVPTDAIRFITGWLSESSS